MELRKSIVVISDRMIIKSHSIKKNYLRTKVGKMFRKKNGKVLN